MMIEARGNIAAGPEKILMLVRTVRKTLFKTIAIGVLWWVGERGLTFNYSKDK